MTDEKKIIDTLIASGIDPGIAESMAKSMAKAAMPKAKKKSNYNPNFHGTARKKIRAVVEVTRTCLTCGRVDTVKEMMEVYDTEADSQKCYVGFCLHCIKTLYTFTKEELISLIVIQNHSDLSLRKLSLRSQIKLARRFSPQALFMRTNGVEEVIETQKGAPPSVKPGKEDPED